MSIDKFEDIDAWKKARELANSVYKVTSKGTFLKDYGLRDQVQRASVSVMANIAEGFGCNSDKEFLQFLSYSYRSALEVQSHLYIALDQDYLGKEDFASIYSIAEGTKKLINGFKRYLNKSTKT